MDKLTPGIGSRWGHLKRGSTYIVTDIGVIEATKTTCVIYKADADGTTWVRPLSEFMDGRFLEILPAFADTAAKRARMP